MNWNIAQAKQQFSQLVQHAQSTPQAILKHHDTVAYLLSANEYAQFQHWRTQSIAPNLHLSLARLRASMVELDDTPLDLPPRRTGASRDHSTEFN